MLSTKNIALDSMVAINGWAIWMQLVGMLPFHLVSFYYYTSLLENKHFCFQFFHNCGK